jgi:hypothetical protein
MPSMRTAAAAVVVSLTAICARPALAHHSRANFDLATVVEIEGVVTEFSWRNPHAFVVIEGTKRGAAKSEPALWTFELNSTPVLARFGWTPQTLHEGDRIVARGNPDRNDDRHFVYANVFARDGKDIWAWGGPQQGQGRTVDASAKSTDFTGVWRIQFQGDVLGRNRPDDVLVNTLPVTPKGQAEVDAFDPDKNPEWDCEPQSMPAILALPYPFEVTRPSADRIVLRYEVNEVERIVHLDQQSHPASAKQSPLGHSIGWFEGNVLMIETSKFSRVRWGNGPGVDSGPQKTTVERYRLADDGKSLAMTFTMTDPEYLSKPVTVEHKYSLNAGYKLQEYVCDPATSRRHLTAGKH